MEYDFLKSALASEGAQFSTQGFLEWFNACAQASYFEVNEIPLAQTSGWCLEPEGKGLCHESGKFFSVQGLDVEIDGPVHQRWQQPIIVQPEIGILGILVKNFKGVPHFLMQLKMEPGNINRAQLSPTVQATKSNYSRVHNGKVPPYLDYFIERKGHVIADQLQSEQGARFFRKRNRNMIIGVEEEIPLKENFCWLTLAQIHQLYCCSNLVNMDARTVLSMVSFALLGSRDSLSTINGDGFSWDLLHSLALGENGLLPTEALISWLVDLKVSYEIKTRLIPLNQLQDWHVSDEDIRHKRGQYFSVIGVTTRAGNREVSEWCQPLLKHDEIGLVGLLCQKIDGVLHFLVCGRLEPGYIDGIEVGPTVSCSEPERRVQAGDGPRFIEYFVNPDAAVVRCSWELSEEGGRFYHFRNRYMLVELAQNETIDITQGYAWATYGQLHALVRHSLYLNVELRSLMAGLPLAGRAVSSCASFC